MDIKVWREKIKKYFPDFVLPAEIGLSVICQLRIMDISNPFGLVYVDVPSSGKTITLNFFSKLSKLVYATDTFTAASFVSNAANKTEEDLKEIDMLPKIRDKVLIVRDLAPVFGMRDDDLLKTMGILTRIFDGEGLITNSGLHGQREYTGKYYFVFLAASTPIRPRVWKVMGNFGSRLFFLNMNTPDKDNETLVKQLSSKLSPRSKERRCRKATEELINEIFYEEEKVKWNKANEDENLLEEIVIISRLVAALRGVINVWKEGYESEQYNLITPQIEKPDRINQSLYNLARGHALLCGREYIDDEDVSVVLEVALSSASMERVKLFKLLIDNNGVLTTRDIEESFNFSKPAALKLMNMFEQLKIAEKSSRYSHDFRHEDVSKLVLNEQFAWFTSERFNELREITHRV